MKYIILVPIYNDRESLKLLINNINSEIKDLNVSATGNGQSRKKAELNAAQKLLNKVEIS